VGRTARAGKTGESLLLLADFEAFFLNKLRDLPIRNMGELPAELLEAHEAAIAQALTKVPASCVFLQLAHLQRWLYSCHIIPAYSLIIL
jgi:superfamily II DNA/RNA helicase